MNRLLLSAAATSLLAFSLFAQENIIRNGCFLDTNSTDWSFNTNGVTASKSYQVKLSTDGKIVSSKYRVEISDPRNSEDAPQLVQRDIALEGGESYILSFIASSSRPGSVRALVKSENGVLTDSASGVLKTNATAQKHTLKFFVEESISNATFQLNLGLFDGATNIAIDSVYLVKNPIPTIKVTTPVSTDRWVSNSERQIRWNNSGSLEKVKIQYSTNNGVTWNIITPAATNFKSFWWTIPSTVFGNSCKIIVSNVDGTIADTSDAFKILESSAIVEGELIKNGDFLDTVDWVFNAYSPAKATGKYENNEYMIKIDTIGEQLWQVKLEQNNVALQMGKTYKLQYDAYAAKARKIQVNICEQVGYRSASGEMMQDITTEKSTYVHYFNLDPASLPEDFAFNKLRLEFNLGNEVGIVYFDNVSLIEVEGVKCMITKPYLGSVLKAGSEFNIQWTDNSISTIDLQYSLDSGATWNSIIDSIENLQAYLWSVPAQSSKNCQIRILSAENDSVIGVSAIFQINKFGAPINMGELISNGSFSNQLSSWNTSFKGADGMAVVVDGVYTIDLSNPGSDLSSVILSQGEMNVLSGTEYTLSFNAFANGNREMSVKVFGDDTVSFLDTTFSVPTIQEKITLKLTPTIDAIARVEFHIGGARAGVFLDEISFHNSAWTPINQKKNVAQRSAPSFTVQSRNGSVMFSLGHNVQGQVAVYALNGTKIRTLKVSEKVLWDGKDAHGKIVARGTYIARLSSNSGNVVSKFVIR